MPFKFRSTLNKVEIELGPDELTPKKHGELDRLKFEHALRMQ
jgi:hypothetical protein